MILQSLFTAVVSPGDRRARSVFCPLAALAILCLSAIPASAQRLTLSFNPDWKFIKADPAGAAATEFDDHAWATVSAPHTYNDVDAFAHWSLPGHKGQMEQWSGRTWYRKTFTPPDTFRGKKVFLEFEAARQITEVYLNGELLGVGKTGFIPFGFDLTPKLRFGRPNVLAVMCDNRFTQETEMAKIAATELPWNSPHWHPAHGGLYRNVYLHVTDPLHISLPLFSFLATAGPYVYASGITDRQATVTVELLVENGRGTEKIDVRCMVLDRDGRCVVNMGKSQQIAGGYTEFKLSGTLGNPRLWDPNSPYPPATGLETLHRWDPDSPYLYRVFCSLQRPRQDDRLVRAAAGHPHREMGRRDGLFHQRPARQAPRLGSETDGRVAGPGRGAARLDALLHAGADERGGRELCPLGALRRRPGEHRRLRPARHGCRPAGRGRRGRRPWLGLDAPRGGLPRRDHLLPQSSLDPDLGGRQPEGEPAHAKELRDIMDRYDPHGGRAYAHRRADKTTAEFMDVGIGTEGGREIARLPVVEGEYDREESPRRVWDDFSPPNFGYPEAKGQTYQLTSEQYAANEVPQYVVKFGKENHCGGANWIFSDSTSGGRVACEVCRASGEVDGVRLPKEAYYVCRVMFRAEPLVHIIGHWTYPPGTKKTVYVASNAEAVELFVNGRSLGRGKASDRYLFTFPDVAWEAGEVKALGYVGDKPVATQSKHTVGPAAALRMTPITGPFGPRADGSDVALIDIEAIDASGDRCPTFQKRVDFEIEGLATWRGGYNSGKINSINNRYLDLECGINRVAVRAGRVPGEIVVRARCEGLKPASVAIASSAVPVTDGITALLPVMPVVDLSKMATGAAEVSATMGGEKPAAGQVRPLHPVAFLFRPGERRPRRIGLEEWPAGVC